MNRSIALFVALVTLLAHILAIYNDGQGNLAFPYDQSYVAYRLARNLIFEGQVQWNPGMTAFESYPSVVWVAIAAVGERLGASFHGLTINVFCQTLGVLAMLFTVILSAQFRPDRAASLIAPLLLVTSGCIAAAAANGMETALFTLFATASFWTFERGRSVRLAVSLALLCLTRPEGALIAASLFFLRLVMRSSRSELEPGERALVPFLAPALVVGLGVFARWTTTGLLLPPICRAVFFPHPGQKAEGAAALVDFARTSISSLLVIYPLILLVRQRLSGTGARALFVALVWMLLVVVQGRSPLPFSETMVPVLPLLFISIQEGIIEVLDGISVLRRRLALLLLALGLTGSALASKEPGDLGPLPGERWHTDWMSPRSSARFGYEETLGRLGLEEEIRNTNRLRGLGLFVRDKVDPSYTVLTAWPGAMGYLSRCQVFDMLARTNPMPGSDRPASWTRRERADIVAALEVDPPYDYVVPLLVARQHAPSRRDLAQIWLDELDSKPEVPGRIDSIERSLAGYELITVPLYTDSRGGGLKRGDPFYLLRSRHLALAPVLELGLEGHTFKVSVRHLSHQQLVDLCVRVQDADGRWWSVRPTGEITASAGVSARRDILLYNTGTRSVELMRGTLPESAGGSPIRAIRAVLVNPLCEEEHTFAAVCEAADRAIR